MFFSKYNFYFFFLKPREENVLHLVFKMEKMIFWGKKKGGKNCTLLHIWKKDFFPEIFIFTTCFLFPKIFFLLVYTWKGKRMTFLHENVFFPSLFYFPLVTHKNFFSSWKTKRMHLAFHIFQFFFSTQFHLNKTVSPMNLFFFLNKKLYLVFDMT